MRVCNFLTVNVITARLKGFASSMAQMRGVNIGSVVGIKPSLAAVDTVVEVCAVSCNSCTVCSKFASCITDKR